jgi:hypothetical protein
LLTNGSPARRINDPSWLPTPSEPKWETFNEIAEPLRAANRRLAPGFILTRQPGGGWRKTLAGSNSHLKNEIALLIW